MSWDVLVFNATRKVDDLDEIEEVLLDIGTWQEFYQLIKQQFPQAILTDNWCQIESEDSSLETSIGPPGEKTSNTIFHLYGPNAVYMLATLCRQYNWQAFDYALDGILALNKPEVNGHQNFTAYLDQIKGSA